jgi:hypothetical protein
MFKTITLTDLAQVMGLEVDAAAALPTVVEVAARKGGISEADLIRQAGRSAELRAYLAGICRQADVQSALRG